MEKRFIITTLLVVICGYAIFGRLITTPTNDASRPGILSSTMKCSSTLGSSSISWYFVPVGKSINVTIASGSFVYPAFTQLYWIDQPINYASNLIIRWANESTTGTYTCSDTEMVAHAQQILIYDCPVSSNASNSLIVGDVISITCSATYLGNQYITPIFYLYDTSASPTFELIDNNTSPQLNTSNSWTRATATFYYTVPCSKFTWMHCGTDFGKTPGNFLRSSPTDTTVFISNVLCVPTDNRMSIAGVISGAMLYFGGMLTCHVTSDPPANYSWTDLTYGNSNTGPNLTVWHDGSFQCRASVNLNGRWYSASKAVYNVTVEKLSSTAKPLYGPIAGGTNVTVLLNNWSKQITNISAVFVGGILEITALQSNRSSNSFVMTTPNATSAVIGQPLPITIEFAPGPYNISTNLSFTYRGNPEITGISPTTFVVTGGTLVTATGTQLSSVAYPLIRATIVVERGSERNSTSEVSFESCEVTAVDGSEMICRMPPINIPYDFLQVLDSEFNNRNTRDTISVNHMTAENLFLLSRSKRHSSALSLTGPNRVDRLFVFVGFILDGYQKYENINDALPETQFHFYSPPEINSTKDILEYDPNKEEFISIKGKHMQRGCRLADYLVHVGGAVCINNDLKDNQLSCRPPKVKPSSTTDTIRCKQHLSVTITLGNLQYQYGCLTYTDQSSTGKVALIIGLTVGLAGLVLFLTIFIVCLIKCCRRKSSKQSDSQYNSGRQEARNPDYDTIEQPEPRQDNVYLRQQYRNTIFPNEGSLTLPYEFYRN